MVGANVLLQFTLSSAKFYFQYAETLLSAYCILSTSLNLYTTLPPKRAARLQHVLHCIIHPYIAVTSLGLQLYCTTYCTAAL